jgi:pimeloyl-ACP methyl ester carboxylesterase
MGLGAQLIAWPDGLCNALVEAGLHVIRFDNRDAGESTHMTSAPPPNFMAAMAGDFSTVSYTLSDMASDTVGLLDALGIASAHIVGASLGGFIAQTIAIEHRSRLRSLTSIMSTTGDRSVGQPHPAVMAAFGGPPPVTREDAIQRAISMFEITRSPGFEADVRTVAESAGRAYDRGFDLTGMVRQAVASMASGDRTPQLRKLTVPTLVIHGTADNVCDVSGGRATATAIPGATLLEIEGMGHNMPRGTWPRLTEAIAAHVRVAAT